jgi:zinc transporter 9
MHKVPTAFGIASFFMQAGLTKAMSIRLLAIFALTSPVAALFTYAVLEMTLTVQMNPNILGVAMIFSAGTFMYVATVHVLPEVQDGHNDHHQVSPEHDPSKIDRQPHSGLQFRTNLVLIAGILSPILFTLGGAHDHGH